MVLREIITGRLLSCWRACARVKTGSRRREDEEPIRARFHSVFGNAVIGIFEVFPLGVFVFAPQVAGAIAGPSAILSVVVGCMAAILSGFSFLDLRARVWKEPSTTYEYIYRIGGEALAFFVGWCSLAHSTALTAAMVRGATQSLNYLMSQRLSYLSMSWFGSYSPTFAANFDMLAFMVCMVLWAILALRLVPLCGKLVVLLVTSVAFVLMLLLLALSINHLQIDNWKGLHVFFPGQYEGVLCGASVFYVTFSFVENLSRFVEYSSLGSYKPHLKSSALSSVVMVIALASTASAVTLMSTASARLVTEQPFSEAFDLAASGMPWVKYVVCLSTMVLLVPAILIQFERSVISIEELAEDGLLMSFLKPEVGAEERCIAGCFIVGCLTAASSAIFDVVTLCLLSALALLLQHFIVLVTVLTMRYRPDDQTGSQLFAATTRPETVEAANENGERAREREAEIVSRTKLTLARFRHPNYASLVGENDDDEELAKEPEIGNYGDFNSVQTETNLSHDFRKHGAMGEESHEFLKIPAELKRTFPDFIDENKENEETMEPTILEESRKEKEKEEDDDDDDERRLHLHPTDDEDAGIHPNSDAGQMTKTKDSSEPLDSTDSSDTDIDAVVEEYLRQRTSSNLVDSEELLDEFPTPPSSDDSRCSTPQTYRKAFLFIVLYVISALVLAATCTHSQRHLATGNAAAVAAVALTSAILISALAGLKSQPEETPPDDTGESRLRVRHLSWIYLASIFLNSAIIVTIPFTALIVLGCWSVVGFLVYLSYAIQHSRQVPPTGHLPEEQRSLLTSQLSSARIPFNMLHENALFPIP